MQAAYVKVPLEVDLKELPIPEIGLDEVFIKVLACERGLYGRLCENASSVAA
jgi:hypothetical protein